ncbi:MAG: Beta-barrel assembly-enhancing protease [Chroococcidiopsis cubana SAG 39.79]|jgi:beta-barrel assembly-enhancing protease|uniref:Peptidase M48 domain-containing protein n=1 Tax=Chroococcidiopsis cubana SAG 39.79 TaxID=388085 RepID=A0AB37UEP0_9CYAN|nr:M48 family metalloprotease [Chroococcidiopsis cubana]MDZ4875782.1 Beta-barrel assembly-enhancing protease [Chroococcidiopsis cubana SAG 39.79]PSB64311.1 peptidase M48 Ste24p [Chroococcidiopsis cubana CCALA 043]RUT07517.1 hypothetical protein DSM107010_49890 [Chroococcidiopsis cubana SAG 39.79]
MAVGLFVGSPQITQAIPWLDILRQGVQVIQLSTISDSQEVELGKQINQQLVTKEVKLYRNPQIERYVNQIGQRLVKSSDRSDIPYTFQVVNNNSVNAFVTMGGFVYVHTGLMRFAQNETQLASVIAHERGRKIAKSRTIFATREPLAFLRRTCTF